MGRRLVDLLTAPFKGVKLHYTFRYGRGVKIWRVACNWQLTLLNLRDGFSVAATPIRDEVTCRKCKKWLRDRGM